MITQSCQANIQRLNSATPVSSSGVDSTFPPDYSSLIWTSFPRQGSSSLQPQAKNVQGWRYPSQISGGASLFGSGISPNDVKQGQISTCFVLSSLSSLAENPSRVQKIFKQQSLGDFKSLQLNVYIRGIPKPLYIDQNLPVNGGRLYFAAQSPRTGSFWVPLLEKAFAKVNRNYEGTNFGWMAEPMRAFTGAPTILYQTNMNQNDMWNMLLQHSNLNYAITGAIMKSNSLGLTPFHAYSILGVYELKQGGKPFQKLVHIRNPWNIDQYTGPWSDNSGLWTTEFKSQVPFLNLNDGAFFMPYTTFAQVFDSFCTTFIHDNFQISYFDKRSASSSETFKFTIKNGGLSFVGVDVYSNRMYPDQCNGGVSGTIQLFAGSIMIGQLSINSNYGFSYIQISNMKPGTYSMRVNANFGRDAVRDITARVYMNENVVITQ